MTRWSCSTTATGARRRRARGGSATPAGTCSSRSSRRAPARRSSRCVGGTPRSRCAPCCSTRGRSSSTRSATRGRSPRSTPRPRPAVHLAAGLLELADREFSEIRDRLQAAPARPARRRRRQDPRISAQELADVPRRALRRGRAGPAPTTTSGSRGCCSSSGSPRSTSSADCWPRSTTPTINERMGYQLPAGAVRRLDDALLDLFGTRYVQLHGNAHRVPLLEAPARQAPHPPQLSRPSSWAEPSLMPGRTVTDAGRRQVSGRVRHASAHCRPHPTGASPSQAVSQRRRTAAPWLR